MHIPSDDNLKIEYLSRVFDRNRVSNAISIRTTSLLVLILFDFDTKFILPGVCVFIITTPLSCYLPIYFIPYLVKS